MKLIIDIPETAYETYKEWHKNKVATVEQSIIANGIPYEEEPQGEWIEKQETPASVSYYCSNCKMRDLPFLPYCPWCGAKMKGGADNEQQSTFKTKRL